MPFLWAHCLQLWELTRVSNDTNITQQKHYTVHLPDYIRVAYHILSNAIIKLFYSDSEAIYVCSLGQKEMIQTDGMCEANKPQLAFMFDLFLQKKKLKLQVIPRKSICLNTSI